MLLIFSRIPGMILFADSENGAPRNGGYREDRGTMSKDILSVIQASMSAFSKGQKLIAIFILESYDKAAS